MRLVESGSSRFNGSHGNPRRRNPLAPPPRPGGRGRRRPRGTPAAATEAALDPDEDAERRRLLRPQETGRGARAAHRVRERVVPEHRRVLEPAVADDHDPRRRLHAIVPVLRRPDRPPAAAGRERAGTRRHHAGRARAAPHRDHLRRSGRPGRRRRRALGGDDPRREAGQPRHGAGGPDRRLQGRHRRGRRRAGRRSRRVRAQPRDRAAAVAPGARAGELRPFVRDPAPREGARRDHQDGADAGPGRRARRAARGVRRAARDRRRHPYARAVPAPVAQTSARRALRAAGRVRGAEGRGAGDGIPSRRIGTDGPIELPRRRPARHRAGAAQPRHLLARR